MSKLGLKFHQKKSLDPMCIRAGVKTKREIINLEKDAHKALWQQKGQITSHKSLFEPYQKGVPFTKETKQILINIYQRYRKICIHKS